MRRRVSIPIRERGDHAHAQACAHVHIHVFDDQSPPDAPMLAALAEFERSFRYPLGASQHFHISHGPHYLPFFQAMGKATLFVATRDGRVLGTIACIERSLQLNGSGTGYVGSGGSGNEATPAAYLCDLKLSPDARQTRVMPRLILGAVRHCHDRNITQAWSVVMRGTSRTPATYTGRLEIPEFIHGGEITVLRLASSASAPTPAPAAAPPGMATDTDVQNIRIRIVSSEVIATARAQITRTRYGYIAANGNSSLRSRMKPVHLLTADGRACGTLEDTFLGKRLLIGGGGSDGGKSSDGSENSGSSELLSTHLSGFAWSDPASGVDLLRQAVAQSATLGIPGLFVSLPQPSVAAFANELQEQARQDLSCTFAPADIYAHGLAHHPYWWVDTADI